MVCLVAVASSMAQGRINFNNANATSPIRINDGTIANVEGVWTAQPGATTVILGTASTAQFGIGPASTQIRLFAGTDSASLSPVLVGTAATQFVLNSAATLASAQGTFQGGSTLNLGLPAGPTYLQFTATSIDGRFFGISPIILVTSTASPASAATVFGSVASASTWNGITMYAVPEPSSMALAGLGAASLLIFRRRK